MMAFRLTDIVQTGYGTKSSPGVWPRLSIAEFSAHNETCANIGNVLWNWRMFLLTGEAKYIDIVELALYNSVLSGISMDGTNSFTLIL